MKQNAFTMVRPRGQDAAPAKPPKRTNHSAAPKSGNVHLLLDSRGRKTVDIAPRTKGAIVVEGQAMSAAQQAKAAKIKKAGTYRAA